MKSLIRSVLIGFVLVCVLGCFGGLYGQLNPGESIAGVVTTNFRANVGYMWRTYENSQTWDNVAVPAARNALLVEAIKQYANVIDIRDITISYISSDSNNSQGRDYYSASGFVIVSGPQTPATPEPVEFNRRAVIRTIERAVERAMQNVRPPARVALQSIRAEDDDLIDFVNDELRVAVINEGYTVTNRANANFIIQGRIDVDVDGSMRLRLTATEIESGDQVGSANEAIR